VVVLVSANGPHGGLGPWPDPN